MSDALDDAAAAALWAISQEQDRTREHIGALYTEGDGFGRTAIADGQGAHVKGALVKPMGTAWAALFHNHPPQTTGVRDMRQTGGGEQFSDDDKAQARKLAKPSYISTPSGATRMFDPGTGKTSDVLAQFPIDWVRSKYLRIAETMK